MSRFTCYAWFVVFYLILVILWGAVVRATGSGAGCGNHWPACNGEIIHRPESVEALIELSHRLTSAFSGFLVMGLLAWAFRAKFSLNQKFIRTMAVLTFVFILIEGGLGAALVRFELVAENASSARAIVVALHLANTLVLLAFATLTAWASAIRQELHFTKMNTTKWALALGLLAYIFLCAIGAVTALGDTLFPVESLAEGIALDLDPTAHFLIQLRVWHPIVAIVVSAYFFGYGYCLRRDNLNRAVDSVVTWVYIIVIGQVIAGFINVILLAPVLMQILHLLLADTLWIALLLLSAHVLLTDYTTEPVSA